MSDSSSLAAELISRFNYADGFRHQYDQRAIENYKLYTGYREQLPPQLAGRSNLHIPKTYELVDSLRARYLRAIFGQSPVIEFVPNPLLYFQEGLNPADYLQMLLTAEDSAKYSTYLVDQQLRNSQVYRRIYDFITSMLVFPAGIMSIGWKYKTKKMKQRGMKLDEETGIYIEDVIEQETVTYDDNELQYVDYYDFWPDPRGIDMDSCRFVFHREWATEDSLKEKLAVLAEAGSGKVYEPDDWETLISAGTSLSGGASERMAEVGLSAETGQGHWENIRHGYQIELLHYWEDERYIIIANRNQVVYDGENHYWHGKKPFVVTSFDPKPGEFYGFSAVELIEHLQHELNTNRNQRIDNVSFVLNRMWKVRRSADVDENDLVSKPHGIIYIDSPDDVQSIETQDITRSSYNEENIIKEDMDNVLGAPAVVRGVEPERRQTATETSVKTNAADIKFQVKTMLHETILERIAIIMDINNQQFVDRPRIFRVEEEWQVVTPDEMRGHHLYRPASSSLDVTSNREVRRQQVLELLQIVEGRPEIDQYELLKMVMEAFSIRGTETLLKPKEQLMEQPGAMPGEQPLQQQAQGPQVQPQGPQGPQVQPQAADNMLGNLLAQAMQGGG